MRIKETKVYLFDELSEEGKEQAILELCDINVFDEWWECIYEDAEQVGLKLTEFDLGRGSYCWGNFIESAKDTAAAIQENPHCMSDTMRLKWLAINVLNAVILFMVRR